MARFFRRGVSKVRFCPVVANLKAPTRAELSAGVDLSGAIAGIGGFSLTNAPIATPDLETSFDSQIDGPDTTADSSFTLYDDDVDEVIRTAIAKGEVGVVVLMPYGDVVGKRCETWPTKSTGVNDQWGLDATAAQLVAGFAVTDKPEQNAVIPAAGA